MMVDLEFFERTNQIVFRVSSSGISGGQFLDVALAQGRIFRMRIVIDAIIRLMNWVPGMLFASLWLGYGFRMQPDKQPHSK